MKQETVWRYRNVAVSTWRLQTCRLPPSFITALPTFLLFLHFLSLFVSLCLLLPLSHSLCICSVFSLLEAFLSFTPVSFLFLLAFP